jgi:hypothetical protein
MVKSGEPMLKTALCTQKNFNPKSEQAFGWAILLCTKLDFNETRVCFCLVLTAVWQFSSAEILKMENSKDWRFKSKSDKLERHMRIKLAATEKSVLLTSRFCV